MKGSAARGRVIPAALTALALAVILMIAFEATVTRVLGVIAIFAFIALGTFAIAIPEFLEGEGEDREIEPER